MLAFMTNPDSGNVAQNRMQHQTGGLQLLRFGLPDTRSPEFVEMLRQQCLALKNDPAEADILAFTEAAAGLIEGWE